MASNRRKSAAVVLALLGVAGLSLASASQLNITSGTLQAGTKALVDCDSNGVTVSYTFGWVGGTYAATGGKVTGIESTCAGGTVGVTALAGTTPTAATVSGAVPVGGGEVSFTLAGSGVAASALTDVSVVIAK